jgi:hypothetical protein
LLLRLAILKKSPPAEKPDAEQQDQQAQASREKITELENKLVDKQRINFISVATAFGK